MLSAARGSLPAYLCCPSLQAAELRAVAIFRVDPASSRIVGSDAVVRVLSGAPEDERLPTLMPALA